MLNVPPEVQKFITSVQGISKDRWNSSKLWITIAAVGLLVWFLKDNIAAIVQPIVYIVCTFLVCRTAHDIAQEFAGASKHGADANVEVAKLDPVSGAVKDAADKVAAAAGI